MAEASSERGGDRPTHRLFGLTLASDFPFDSRLPEGAGPVDLEFAVAARAPFEARKTDPVYESPLVDESGDSRCRLYRHPHGELLSFADALDFYLGERRIDCHLGDEARRELVEIRLLGPVLAYWLERLALCVLHASAVVMDGRAVAFMASNHGGKTTLAAALMSFGAPLLSDDLLPVEQRAERFVARAGYPQMRMRPDGLAHFVADPELRRRLRPRLGKWWVPVGRAGFGTFHPEASPLRCIYLPERAATAASTPAVRISALPARQAVIELLRRSFSPYIVEAVGLQPRRLELFSLLVSRVPVRRIAYPTGFEALPLVREALRADLDAL